VCETLALHRSKPCKCKNFEGAIIWHFNTLGADFRREEHIPPNDEGLSKEKRLDFWAAAFVVKLKSVIQHLPRSKRRSKMNRFRLVVIILCLTLGALAFPCNVNADAWDKKTIVTFSQPVEIPGVGAQVLPAGKYVFKLLDSSSNRNIVQIFNEDQTHVYATILAIPNYRLRATDKTVMTFGERPPVLGWTTRLGTRMRTLRA
jgi:hypothetical protein